MAVSAHNSGGAPPGPDACVVGVDFGTLSGRALVVHHRVRVLVHRGAKLGPVPDPDDQRPAGQRAEVHADDDAVCFRHLLRHVASLR